MKENVEIWRDSNGVPHINGETLSDVFWGQGFAHAKDRGMQCILMRILGQGRASELLDSSDETLEIDTFFRKMNWQGHIELNRSTIEPEVLGFLKSYSDGVNAAFQLKTPWEFKLLGVRIETWKPEDSILISRMIGYLTLVQSQTEMERFFVELAQAGLSEAHLKELFPGLLHGLDMDLLKKVKIQERIVPPENLWNIAIPRMMASNNWVVSGDKTASGKPIVSNDPHLEINRLPNVWCEQILKSGDQFMAGGTMPGFPGVLTGRNKDLAWGVTYAFIDSVDSWIEKCQEGKYYREDDEWQEFKQRKETIKRKKKEAIELVFYENEHGVLDGNPYEEGLYLATRWAASKSGPASFSSFLKMWNAATVDEGMKLFGQVETGWSFVLADTKGDIGFQMSGLVPIRREGISGFIPLPGWKSENNWLGTVKPEDMPRIKNPENGYFATANNDLNVYGNAKPINMPMGSYRADRIADLLSERKNMQIQDMFKMHFDVYSLQAEIFMKHLSPLLPETEQATILKGWDFKYDLESRGAFLFEAFYTELYRTVFGKNGMGENIIDYLASETGVFIDFYHQFDSILLSETSIWFEGKTKTELFSEVASRALDIEPKTWGSQRKFMLKHLLFGDKLPAFLGFDRGPVMGLGGRATIHQGQIYRSAGRDTTFMPSYRLVCDLENHSCHTNLVGGPSDRRFSKWYCSDLKNWIRGVYKEISPEITGPKLRF